MVTSRNRTAIFERVGTLGPLRLHRKILRQEISHPAHDPVLAQKCPAYSGTETPKVTMDGKAGAVYAEIPNLYAAAQDVVLPAVRQIGR